MADAHKTEKATPHRRRKAREQGQVARSRDLSGTLALCGALGLIVWQGTSAAHLWSDLFRNSIEEAGHNQFSCMPLMLWAGWVILRCAIPVMAVAWCLSLGSSVMQGGVLIAGEALTPKMERLNPGNKLKQIFSITGLSGLLKSVLPFAAIVYVAIIVVGKHWAELLESSNVRTPAFLRFLFSVVLEVIVKAGVIMLAWSGVDYFLTWRKMESDLKMSREELRQESKETEGNPHTKLRVRRIQRQMRRSQMLRETQRATVVVTNPTHFAVALLYELDMEAPVVLAKGQNLLAERMKDIAREKEIPILENPPLARALYKSVEVGGAIPAGLYTAVAEILAFVYQAQAQARRGGVRPSAN